MSFSSAGPNGARECATLLRTCSNTAFETQMPPGSASGSSCAAMFTPSLVEAAFAWARERQPAQPLTIGAWTDFDSPFSRRLMELSDVVSFHAYDGLAATEAKVKICPEHGRPVLCIECMARGHGRASS